ncbi:LuxR family transcriptional regulator [Pseudomonas sp. RIT412]|nr:LuxR family transcriptional regulator [Pseudomonas sp. RIT 409]RAU47297.1 LuxR family transcriptional regulator [Pseudomonas sp. RIT 412]
MATAGPLIHSGLTLREIEVLKWSAEGKTAAEVALILDVKIRTVNFHVSSAIRKMGVTNKMSAVVQAALHGMLPLADAADMSVSGPTKTEMREREKHVKSLVS